jgi:hypothetical protein
VNPQLSSSLAQAPFERAATQAIQGHFSALSRLDLTQGRQVLRHILFSPAREGSGSFFGRQFADCHHLITSVRFQAQRNASRLTARTSTRTSLLRKGLSSA